MDSSGRPPRGAVPGPLPHPPAQAGRPGGEGTVAAGPASAPSGFRPPPPERKATADHVPPAVREDPTGPAGAQRPARDPHLQPLTTVLLVARLVHRLHPDRLDLA